MTAARLLLLGLLASLLLPALPARAQDADDRDRKLGELTDDLERKSEAELRALRERLRKARAREAVKRKREAARHIAESLLSELDPETRKKVERLTEPRQNALRRYLVDRLAETVRAQFLRSLSEEEARELRGLRGPGRMRALLRMRLRSSLTDAERERLAKMTPPEREKWEVRRLRVAYRAQIAKARKEVVAGVGRLLDLSPEKLDAELRRPWVVAKLRRVGREHLARRILRLPHGEIRRQLAKLDEIRRLPAEDRRAALARWEAQLPKIPQ